MYTPAHFAETRLDVMQALVRAYPLATLVTCGGDGLRADPVPMLWLPDPAPHGRLIGHVARANPVATDIDLNIEALAIFNGPQAYVAPSWYPTKAEHGRAVPTWNYATVHARGAVRLIEDPAWLRAQIEALTQQQEATRDHPWHVDEAPAEYIQRLLAAIVGIELTITRIEGKWKMSQNQPAQNRAGVVDGLRAETTDGTDAVAALVARGRG